MSSPTIKDVAKLAGVSISTVSRVMNDSKPVSPEARRKVLDAIQKLDFKPNELARSLVMKRSNMIGVIVKDLGISYMAQIVRGIEEIGRMYKFDILLSSTYGDLEQEAKIIDFMFTKQVEGIIVISENTKPKITYKLKNQAIPFLLIDKLYDYNDIYTVGIDFYAAAKNMVECLIEKNHENILFLEGAKGSKVASEKERAYLDVMEKNSLTSHVVECPGIGVEEGYEVGDKVRSEMEANDISVVFCSEDSIAIGLMNYFYDNHIKVPETISVVGFGDIPMASLYRPALTTVREPFYDIGAVAMRKLVKELKDKDKLASSAILSSEIVVRDSILNL